MRDLGDYTISIDAIAQRSKTRTRWLVSVKVGGPAARQKSAACVDITRSKRARDSCYLE